VYHEYGFKVAVNAERPVVSGSLRPVLKARVNIHGDEEILFSYRKSIEMPKTYEEEKFARIRGSEDPDMWPYPFTRKSVIEYLIAFRDKNRSKYKEALAFVQSAIHHPIQTAVLIQFHTTTLNTIDLTNADFARCRSVPSDKSSINSVSQHVTLPTTMFKSYTFLKNITRYCLF
jgi:hypothetical protein